MNDDLRRIVDRMKMEEFVPSRETDPVSKERLGRLRADPADCREQLASLTARWESRSPPSTVSAS
jgi:ATP-dependent Clp protease ATP-binding subunit ClpB